MVIGNNPVCPVFACHGIAIVCIGIENWFTGLAKTVHSTAVTALWIENKYCTIFMRIKIGRAGAISSEISHHYGELVLKT